MDYDLIVVKTLERVYKNYYYIIRGIQQGRCLEIYSLVQDGILEPEVGASRVSMSLDDFADAM